MPSDAERDPGGGERGPETRMTSDERVEQITQGLTDWREGFLAYLLLPDVDLTESRMVEHFTDAYAGWYPDRARFMEGQVASLGWADALDTFKEERGIPASALDLDWDVIWDHCCEIYSVVERLGGVHVFMH